MAILSPTRGAPASSEIRNNLSLGITGVGQREEIESILSKIDQTIGDAYMRQSVVFHSDAAVLYDGLEIQNEDSSIEIRLAQTNTGAIHLYSIPQGEYLPVASDGDFVYAVVARDGSGTGTVPSTTLTFANNNLVAGVSVMPPLENSNLFYIPLVVRIDGALGKRYIHWFFGHGVLAEGSKAPVGLAGTADDPATTANLFSMRAERRWHANVDEFFTDNMIARYLETRIDAVNFPYTAVLDSTQRGLDFVAGGEEFTTINMLDPGFKVAGADLYSAEVQVFYSLDKIDTNPIVELSRDGTNFTPVVLERNADTDLYVGRLDFPEEPSYNYNDGYTTDNGSLFLDGASNSFISQQIVDTTESFYANKIQLLLSKSGTPGGAVRVVVARDNGSGEPNTDNNGTLILSDWVAVSSIPAGPSLVDFSLQDVIPMGNVHIYLESNQAYKTSAAPGNRIEARVDTSSVDLPLKFSANGSTWSTQASTTLYYQFEGRRHDLRVRVESTDVDVNFQGLAVTYHSQKTIETGFINDNIFKINGNGVNQFVLNFYPEHKSLQAFVHETGQVFRYPVFDIVGKTVTFPVAFFDDEAPLTIEFIQALGSSFDNSDRNRSLLVENKLGSTDPNIDLSEAGRGIRLRADNGVLVEASLSWNGANYEWAFTPLP